MTYTKFKSDLLDASTTYAYLPVGVIIMLAGPYSRLSNSDLAEIGLLACNGQDISTTTYSSLYSVIGTNYNTNPNTSGIVTTPSAGFFRVPNLHNNKIAVSGTGNTATVGTITSSSTHSHLVSNTNNIVTWNIANNNTSMEHQHNAFSSNLAWNTDTFGVNHTHAGYVGGNTSTFQQVLNTDYSLATNGNTNNTGTPRHDHALTFNSGSNASTTWAHTANHTSLTTGLTNNTQYNTATTAFTNAHVHTATLDVTNANSALTGYPIPYANMLYFIKAK